MNRSTLEFWATTCYTTLPKHTLSLFKKLNSQVLLNLKLNQSDQLYASNRDHHPESTLGAAGAVVG